MILFHVFVFGVTIDNCLNLVWQQKITCLYWLLNRLPYCLCIVCLNC